MTYRKKLIEVALPLNAINEASAREKSIRLGHPSTFHLWWSRKPLATCRAVLFASLIDDPSEHPEKFLTERDQDQERLRLFRLIEDLVKWENSNNRVILDRVRAEIYASTGGKPPSFLDPFAGGGSIPLEAQRLGLESYASDLNPVAVLINKALLEIPSKFASGFPVNPDAAKSLMERDWHGAQGLADDIRYYGKWMRDEAEQRIGHLYPKVSLPKEYGGIDVTVIAWLWVRSVICPNPACGAQMPLTNKWWLSTKKGRETWIEPEIDRSTDRLIVKFNIRSGEGSPGDGTVNRRGATCIVCDAAVSFDYIRSEGKAGHMTPLLTAVVAEGPRGRVYLPANENHVATAMLAEPAWKPATELPHNPRDFKTPNYGMTTFGDLFTARQLVALNTFSDLVSEAREKILADALITSRHIDNTSVEKGRLEVNVYADAVATYLGMNVSRLANRSSAVCFWDALGENVQQVFARQAIPMTWDFVEANPFSSSTGNFMGQIGYITSVLETNPYIVLGHAEQLDAASNNNRSTAFIISTDPPYYDNISYADLSDFFYIWLHRSLSTIYPSLFGTLLVPKAQELVATSYRFNGDKEKANTFFETGLGMAFAQISKVQHPDYPLTVYYAFKQAESDKSNDDTPWATASTGWETMLEGLIQSGFTITGTWPVRTELITNLKKHMSSLASSIVIVCRPRPVDAPISSRRQFLNALKSELPLALKQMQHGSIAPVDLAQASIGPGMAIYSRYSKVVESDGSPLTIRTALQLINRALDEVLAEQEGEYDVETRWAVAWFEDCAMEEGSYGRAETLSKAKNMDIQRLVEAGLVEAKSGKVRLLKREELSAEWKPAQHTHLTVWEVMQRMIFALDKHGEDGAASVLSQFGEQAETARDLAYRLYTVCERKGWTQEALAYNSLVVSWSEVSKEALKQASTGYIMQPTLLGEI